MSQAKIRLCLVLNRVLVLVALFVAFARYVGVGSHEMVHLLLRLGKELSLGEVKLLLEAFASILSCLGGRDAFAALGSAFAVLLLRCARSLFWRPSVALLQTIHFGDGAVREELWSVWRAHVLLDLSFFLRIMTMALHVLASINRYSMVLYRILELRGRPITRGIARS